jgi:hypothetical protein
MRFKQGKYTLKHPEKYIGDATNVVFRSSWELRMHNFLDGNSQILKWASEELPIKYIHPLDQKVHTYWPDYYVEYKKQDGTIVKEVLEIKPSKDQKRSKSRNPKTKMNEDITFITNQAKWTYAKQFCDSKGMTFRVLTEKDLFK